jgi:PhnB protein
MSKQPNIDQIDRAITDIMANPDATPPVDSSLEDLILIARDLFTMPAPSFKAQLRLQLERKAPMSTSTKTVQFRAGFRTVTPYIFVPELEELIGFLRQVFGAVDTGRSTHESGAIHAEVRIGDSMVMIGGGPSYKGPRKPMMLRALVANADEVYRRALDAGAGSTLNMTESYGERFGCVLDRFGNQWIISTQIGPSYAEGLDHSITTFLKVRNAAKLIDFMKRAFGAEEVMRAEGPGGQVRHAIVRIGDSVIAPSDAGEEMLFPPQLYLYVPDVDALYDRAVRAGAQPTYAPTDHAYGDRGAGVTDEWGNFWYIATPLQR